jgi:putative transposase
MPHFRLFYHFVWTTKDRLPLITTETQHVIHAAILAKAVELRALVHAINSVSDHVHLLVTVPPAMSLSEFIRLIKGNSSHLVTQTFKDQVPFEWQQDYGVYTVSESHVPTVLRYVENQQKHHDEQRLDARLEPQ